MSMKNSFFVESYVILSEMKCSEESSQATVSLTYWLCLDSTSQKQITHYVHECLSDSEWRSF